MVAPWLPIRVADSLGQDGLPEVAAERKETLMALRIKKMAIAAVPAAALAAAFAASGARAATVGPCWSNPAQTCHPYMAHTWNPWSSPWSPGPNYWPINAGTRVNQVCWTTGAYQLGTAKWFYVVSTAYPFTSGYVPANAVGSQIIVGHC
jgi:hypothetical protein